VGTLSGPTLILAGPMQVARCCDSFAKYPAAYTDAAGCSANSNNDRPVTAYSLPAAKLPVSASVSEVGVDQQPPMRSTGRLGEGELDEVVMAVQ